MIKKIIFFDVETNGVNETDSVLSMSALKASFDTETFKFEKIDVFDRFYFRNIGEEINYDAIKVNGLTDDEIEKRRNGATYPRTFKEDLNNFFDFCEGSKHFIAHNIRFDRKFLPFKLEYQFDSMLENVNILKIPSNNNFSQYKWPKLSECADFYGIDLDENELHNSMYDVLIMARVIFKMSKNSNTKQIIKRFFVDNISTVMR